jgi:PAS domain S-box-containing protein
MPFPVEALIEGSLDAVVLLDGSGHVAAANEALCRLAGKSRSQLVGQPFDAVGRLEPALQRVPGPGLSPSVPTSGRLVRLDGETREVNCLVTTLEAGWILMTLADVTDVRRAQKSADRMRRLYSVLSRANAVIFRSQDAGALFREVCRVAVAEGGFRMAWVGMIGPSGRLKPVASAGDDGYLEGIQVSIHDVP